MRTAPPSISERDFQAQVVAEPVGVTPEGRAAVLAAMQQLAAGKGLPS